MITSPSHHLPFFPKEKTFWAVNVFALLLGLDKLNFSGNSLQGLLAANHTMLFWIALGIVWLLSIAIGILMVLVFRHFYYRRQWGERKLLASLALAVVIALTAGLTHSFLVTLPFDYVLGSSFEVYGESELLLISGPVPYAFSRGIVMAILSFLWLLAYWGISASLHARKLAFNAVLLENDLRGARLNALAGQINPHFLFNALNNIRFMIAADPRRAEDSLVDLSEILRHSLDSSRKDKVSIGEELAITRKYLGLMQNQMQDRLRFTIDATPEACRMQIPPMTLQMLAENAIRHGVGESPEGGQVDIACRIHDGQLEIDVSNTSTLTREAAGTLIREQQIPGGDNEKKSGGVGLANIRKRLSLLYGDRAAMNMNFKDNRINIAINLPCEASA